MKKPNIMILCHDMGLMPSVELLVEDFVRAASKLDESFSFKKPYVSFEFHPDNIEHASDIACRARQVMERLNQ